MTSTSPDAIRAETVMITGHNGDDIEAYRAVPLAPGRRGGVVGTHRMPGYDGDDKGVRTPARGRRLPRNLPEPVLAQAPGADTDDAAAAARAAGGVPDERLVGDVAGAIEHLRGLDGANGKLGVMGHCSGGRHAVLVACFR